MRDMKGSSREGGQGGEGMKQEVSVSSHSVTEDDGLFFDLLDKVFGSKGLVIRLSSKDVPFPITIKSGVDFSFPGVEDGRWWGGRGEAKTSRWRPDRFPVAKPGLLRLTPILNPVKEAGPEIAHPSTSPIEQQLSENKFDASLSEWVANIENNQERTSPSSINPTAPHDVGIVDHFHLRAYPLGRRSCESL
jgi:hypothetical protein